MLKLAILLIGCAALTAAGTYDYTVGSDKWVNVISSLSTFQFWRGNQTWNLSSDNGTFIQMDCPRFSLSYDKTRPMEEGCAVSRLVLDDGVESKTYCGAQPLFQYISQSPKVTINLLSATAGGFLDCKAIAIPNQSQ